MFSSRVRMEKSKVSAIDNNGGNHNMSEYQGSSIMTE